MTTYHLLLITALLANSFIWTYLYAQRKGSAVYGAYMAYVVALLWWLITDLSLEFSFSESWRPLIIKAGSIGWLSIGFLFLHFIYAILEQKKDNVYKFILAIALVSIAISLTTNMVVSGAAIQGRGWHIVAGPWYSGLVFAAIVIPCLYAIFIALQACFQESNPTRWRQLLLLAIGSSIALLLGAVFDVILPQFFQNYDYVLLASSTTTIQSLFIYFAVIRHRFMALSVEEVASSMFAELGDGVMLANEDGWIVEVNAAAKEILRLEQWRDSGVLVSELLSADLIFPCHGETEITLDHHGQKIILLVSQAETTGTGYHRSGWIILLKDITERKHAEQEKQHMQGRVEHAQRLESLGVLAGGVAHDFNNLLAVIMGHAGMAVKKAHQDSPAVEKHLQQILRSSDHAADLCKQMLAYSGRGQFILQHLNLSQISQDMQQLLKVSIGKGVVITYRLEDQLPMIEADAAQMQQVILSLITNAAEAIDDHRGNISVFTGVIHMDASDFTSTDGKADLPEGDYVFFEVTDTGCGMDEETKAKVFEPFFSTKFTGRGLGMSAVLGIVRSQHGAIRISSKVGKGTTVELFFPVIKTTAAVETSNDIVDEHDWQASGTVLIVDDEGAVRKSASMMLEDMGFETLTAVDGLDGVEVYRRSQNEIVAVLLDMTMPNLDGKGCFHELRRINEDVKVVLSSGYNEQEATNSFTGKGLAGFIQKPYTPQMLEEIMRKTINQPGTTCL